MEMFRKPTWKELRINAPHIGTVFIHSVKPTRPLIVSSIVDDEIYRVDLEGGVGAWGTVDDWRDEIRHRTIEVVYEPPKNSL